MTENFTQDPDCEPYHNSRIQDSSCGVAEVQEGGSASPEYPMGNETGEYRRNVGDSPQVVEGEGGSISNALCTELVNPESTPYCPLTLKMLQTRVRW